MTPRSQGLHAGRTYVVTGSRVGIGAAAVALLRDAGAHVITVDIADSDVCADLGALEGIGAVADRIVELADGVLHGFVSAAGVGPTGRQSSHLLAVNAFAPMELATRLRPVLAGADRPRVTMLSTNGITLHPNPISTNLVERCLTKAYDQALVDVDAEITSYVAYCLSKRVLTTWVRSKAPTQEWIGAGINMNVVAPGATDTAMHRERAVDPKQTSYVETFPNPLGRLLTSEEVAEVVYFAMSPSMGGLVGSVLFCDGGADAYFHPTKPEARVSAP